jgi:hypothetical protein
LTRAPSHAPLFGDVIWLRSEVYTRAVSLVAKFPSTIDRAGNLRNPSPSTSPARSRRWRRHEPRARIRAGCGHPPAPSGPANFPARASALPSDRLASAKTKMAKRTSTGNSMIGSLAPASAGRNICQPKLGKRGKGSAPCDAWSPAMAKRRPGHRSSCRFAVVLQREVRRAKAVRIKQYSARLVQIRTTEGQHAGRTRRAKARRQRRWLLRAAISAGAIAAPPPQEVTRTEIIRADRKRKVPSFCNSSVPLQWRSDHSNGTV